MPMISLHKLSIVIPCYNERYTILPLLARVEGADVDAEKEIIIVDDGSTDGTRELLQEISLRYTVVFLPYNQGKGAALRAGFARATGDYVVVQDADAEYDPRDLKKMIELARQIGAKVIYGSRRLARNPKAGISYYAGGVFLTWLTNFLYGTRITDEPTCYKMFERNLLQSIPLTCTGFEFCPEVTAKVARMGERIHEVPITYAPRSRAAGKKIQWRDGMIAIWTLLRHRWWNPKKRLLVITQRVNLDDSNLAFFHEWIQEFAKQCAQVTVIAHTVGRHALPSNVRVVAIDPGPKFFRYVCMLFVLCREIPRHSAVFVHMAPEFAILAAPIARLLGRPVALWYVHKAVTVRLKLAERMVNFIFTASSESCRIASEKIRIVGHGIDTKLFSPAPLSPPSSPYRLLTVGRLSPVKRIEVVLEAMAQIRAQGIADVTLMVAGDAYLPSDREYVAILKARTQELGIAEAVQWRGVVPHNQMPALYRSYHALIHTSETGSMDKVALEALSCGILVFSSSEAYRVLLPSEFQFEKGNARALAERILAMRGIRVPETLINRIREGHALPQCINRIVALL